MTHRPRLHAPSSRRSASSPPRDGRTRRRGRRNGSSSARTSPASGALAFALRPAAGSPPPRGPRRLMQAGASCRRGPSPRRPRPRHCAKMARAPPVRRRVRGARRRLPRGAFGSTPALSSASAAHPDHFGRTPRACVAVALLRALWVRASSRSKRLHTATPVRQRRCSTDAAVHVAVVGVGSGSQKTARRASRVTARARRSPRAADRRVLRASGRRRRAVREQQPTTLRCPSYAA